ncbi:glycosyltransferase family 4 protein [Massilia glaciei]|uniref:Glycosyltransferase family 1 protein n=1 Tax=Massilia glaciei TaxID=1524097 RepID=A0A2U2I4A3_9BURK|nr:glycosyltransferase family 1 protein [Massilia glaciei]PWF54620.1 glycosyltransferase family 1 protein [Massilia glaciei]
MHLVDITMFYAAEGGGVSTYLNAKARWLAQRSSVRHTICSPTVQTGGCAPALVQVPGIALPGIHGYHMPRSVSGLARILRRLEPDLIEFGDAGHCAWAALRIKRRTGIPVVAFYHSDLPRLVENRMGGFAAGAVKKYLFNLYRRCDMVLAPSRLMVQQLGAFGIGGAIHQPLGIDTATFCPQRRVPTLRAHLNLPPEARLLVYAGRFTPEKKLSVLIDAVRRLGRPYHLLLIGGGAALPQHPQISFMPFKRDQRALARLLASCDVLVHPGDCETFGLIVLEAMACGLPVVASNGGGVAELVDPDTGILVAPDSVAQLCEGIEAIYQSDREALGQNACRKARANHDWNQIVPQLLGRYAGLLATRERAELQAEHVCVNK